MANIHIGTDNIGSYSHDMNNLNTVISKLKSAGHNVTGAGRGDNAIQGHMTRSSNKCDIMIQIAGGLCPGTFLDFNWGTRPGGYYYADKFGFLIETSVWTNYAKYNPKTYKLPASAWDDSFSQGKLDKSKVVGRTWKDICEDKTNFARCIGFVEGKGGDEIGNNLVSLLKGGSSSSSGTGEDVGGGSSILDLIKQVCSDWDSLGVELSLDGDTMGIRRTNPNSSKPLTKSSIVNDTLSMTDYDSNTPNTNGDVKDNYLINRFGEIPLDEEIQSTWKDQVLQVAQRGHGHSIDLKTKLNKDYQMGKWVALDIDDLEFNKRKYYISKSSYQDERVMSLTLEPAPPSIYVEVPEVTEEETETEEGDESTEEDES